MLVAASLWAALLCAQDDKLAKHISFASHAEPVRSVLTRLSTATGLTLTVSGPLQSDIVVLRFDDVPVRDVLDKIAFVTAGQWTKTADGLLLVRKAKEPDSDLAETSKKYRAWLVDCLAKETKFMAASGPLTEAKALASLKRASISRRLMTIDSESPDWSALKQTMEDLAASPESRVLLQIVKDMDLDKLAAICVAGKDVVFANSPTILQLPLTVDPKVWGKYLAEQNTNTNAYNTLYAPSNSSIEWIAQRSIEKESITTAPAKVIICIWPSMEPVPELNVSGSFYSADGRFLEAGSVSICSLTPPKDEELQAEAPRSAADTAPLELSAEAREMATIIHGQWSGDPPKYVTPELQKKLLRPDLYEPLSLLASEVLLECARQRKANLAACLYDMAFTEIGFGAVDPKWTATNVFEDDMGSNGLDCLEKDGWITVRPKDPEEATSTRINRPAFTRLLQTGAKKGSLSIDDFSSYAFLSESEEEDDAGWLAEVALRRELPVRTNRWLVLKLYGSLTLEQRQRLLGGGRLYFRELGERQTRWLLREISEDPSNISSVDKNGDDDGLFRPLWTEPTEVLAGGLNSNGWIELTQKREQLFDLESKNSEEMNDFDTLSLEDFAYRLYFSKHPKLTEGPLHLISVQPHQDVSLNFKLRLAPRAICEFELKDSIKEPGAGYPIDKLPKWISDLTGELFKKFDRQVKTGELGGG